MNENHALTPNGTPDAPQKSSRIPLIAALILLLLFVFTFLLVSNGLSQDLERSREQADLAAMKAAAATGEYLLRNESEKGEDFWFDAGTLWVVDGGDAPPSAYGLGTARDAGVAAAGSDYNGAGDYTGKVLRIHLNRADPDHGVTLEWVPAD